MAGNLILKTNFRWRKFIAIWACFLLLFLAALVSYVSFSLNPPLHFFTTPPG